MAHRPRVVLITGVAGSGGSYLAEYIAEHHPKVKIHGIARRRKGFSYENLRAIQSKVKVHDCDLNDYGRVLKVIKSVRPDTIFHLASNANVRASFDKPYEVLSNNMIGTTNLFEAVKAARINPVIQHCSTSEVYGQVKPNEVPIKESNPFRPASPYAVSKAAQDLLGWTYFRSYNMNIIRTRMFTYINPRRPDLFATAFARQVVLIEKDRQKELIHGNLASVRTLIDVRDAMEAYWLAAVHGKPGEAYNIGGETTMTVGQFLEILKKKSHVAFKTRVNPALLRPSDVTLQIPCVDKFRKATGWKPRFRFEESVDLLLDHWRNKLK